MLTADDTQWSKKVYKDRSLHDLINKDWLLYIMKGKLKNPFTLRAAEYKLQISFFNVFLVVCAVSGDPTPLNRRMHSHLTSFTLWTPHT